MEEIVIGVDAHKSNHTFVAVNRVGRKLGQKTSGSTSDAHAEAMKWARERFGHDVIWALEDCRNLTARLERELLAAGHRVVRVPPHLMSRTRTSSRELGKSDPIDALAVARTVLREPDLPVAAHDTVSMELRLLVDRREDLIRFRAATINRLLVRTHDLDPVWGKPLNWEAKRPREALGSWLATQQGIVSELARDEYDDILRLTEAARLLSGRIGQRIREVAPDLLALPGCGELTAAKIVAEVADIRRFKSEAAFARHAGVAPIPHWSGAVNRSLRPVRHGNRQLNAALHRIAMVQITHPGPGRDYFQRRLAEGDSRQRALRSLKRRLARVVFNRLHGRTAPTQRDPIRKLPRVLLLPLADLSMGGQRRGCDSGDSPAFPRPVGRPAVLDSYQIRLVRSMRSGGEKVPAIAAAMGVSNSTIKRALASDDDAQ